MSGMDDALRDLLRRKADELTSPPGGVPPALVRRARFRMARNSAAVAAVVLLLVAGALTGYQAFAGSNAEGPAGHPSAPAVHPSHTPPSSPAHTSSPPPSGAPAPTRCTVEQLHITTGSPAHSSPLAISMRNNGSTTCTLKGWPGLALLSGHTLMDTHVVRQHSTHPPQLVTLTHGASAFFLWSYRAPANGQTCPLSDGLEVTPPGASGYATLHNDDRGHGLFIRACGGVLRTGAMYPSTSKLPFGS